MFLESYMKKNYKEEVSGETSEDSSERIPFLHSHLVYSFDLPTFPEEEWVIFLSLLPIPQMFFPARFPILTLLPKFPVFVPDD